MTGKTISTGNAAQLCNVTRDTILKWIKKGLINANRTPGGHYRVTEESIKEYLTDGISLSDNNKTAVSGETLETTPKLPTNWTPCWEYMSEDDTIRDSCQQCIVYRSKAHRCFEMSDLGQPNGFQGTYCETTCNECSFFKESVGWKNNHNILVITEDEYIIGSLIKGLHRTQLMLRFTSSIYECSALIDSFKPGVLLVDFELQQVQVENLCQRISEDKRLPSAKIIAITPKGVSPEALRFCSRSICAHLEKPVSLEHLEVCIQTLEGKLVN